MALGDRARFVISGFDEVGGRAGGTFITETELEVPVSLSVMAGG